MTFDKETIEELEAPLESELVSQREGAGGRMLDYIEGYTAIDQANRIFGFNGWGYRVDSVKFESAAGPAGAYMATVTVGVEGASRGDVGYNEITLKRDGTIPDGAHELAYKASITDGLKRALRTFGNQFGNALYGGGSQSTDSGAQGASGGGQRQPMRICPECGEQAVIKGKAEYGGGFVCWKARGGCGTKFPDHDEPMTSTAQYFDSLADHDMVMGVLDPLEVDEFNVAFNEIRRIKGAKDHGMLDALKEMADMKEYEWDGDAFVYAPEVRMPR